MSQIKTPRTIQVGDTIGDLAFGPVTRTMLCLYAGASLDHNPIHIDSDFAKEAGQDDVFAHGMLGMAQFGRLVSNWASIEALQSLSTRFTAIVPVGSKLRFTGKVAARAEAAGKTIVILDLEAFLEGGLKAFSGRAEVVVEA
ncbi:MaoC/PaaZ C-terminal domain-containing protein [Lutimaribacter marinistellae]|uniref:MaoC/PaaZ C-terminal domain-containing protein n=1 Tax=Lutimaribacter marinistellae TaxID=1820329 RepID=A0ABV7TD44_9RHOB